jgi:hypothetical protein
MTPPGGHQQYPPRGWKGGVLVGILAIVLVLGLAFGGYWVFSEMDSEEAPPPVAAGQDLEEAPIGCAVFDEADVAPYIPGRIDHGPGPSGANPGVGEDRDQGYCGWNNPDFTEENVRQAHVIVASYVYHAKRGASGVDRAKGHLKDRVGTNAVAVQVADADEAMFIELADSVAAITVRYRNVVYHLDYNNQNEGADVKGAATELATIALSKVVAG